MDRNNLKEKKKKEKERSQIMRSVLSSGNKSTEVAAKKLFKAAGIKGWRFHVKGLPGRPDFVFPKRKIVIFIDGCFWHGCKRHLRMPKTNKKYWHSKITGNIQRDKKTSEGLKKNGWRVIRIWEHDLKKGQPRSIKKVLKTQVINFFTSKPI